MRGTIIVLLEAIILTCLSQASGDELPVVAWQGRTMGSDYVVKVVGAKPDDGKIAGLKKEIEAALAEVNRQMSNWHPDSELSCFNRADPGKSCRVSAEFARVTRFALELSRSSQGAFDPTLGPLVNLWGFGEQGGEKSVPVPERLREAMARTGWHHLTVNDADELSKDVAGLSLDLGAVAKGFAVDEMVRVLRRHGHGNVYASIAGEVRVTGVNPRGAKWALGISVPVDRWRENDPMAAVVHLSDRALSTSGDYQKFFVDAAGRRRCHIIDPRTGAPVQHRLAGVTVVAPDSMTADGLSTTLFVLGLEEGRKFIESRPEAAALFLTREQDGTFRQHASSRFEQFTGYRP